MSDSGQSKSFMPTMQRLKKAREEGNSLFVTQINTGVVLFVFFIIFPLIISALARIYFQLFDLIAQNGLSRRPRFLHQIIGAIISSEATTIITLISTFSLVAVTCSIIQLKGLRFVPLKIKFESFNIVENAKQKFSRKNLIKLFLDIGFIVIFLFIGYLLCASNIKSIASLVYLDIGQQIEFLNYLYVRVLFLTAISLSIFLIIVYSIEKFFYIDGLMMTREEVEKEHEDNEGKSEVKMRIRELRQELYEDDDSYVDALLRDLGTFVVSNPTHYAILLFYSRETLPLILIKGKDNLAKRIMSRAKLVGIPVIQHKYMARQLFALTNPGDYIPKVLITDIGQIIGQNFNLIKPFIREKSALQKLAVKSGKT